jgi:hypothetical protein
MLFDLISKLKHVLVVAPAAAFTSDQNASATGVDTKDFKSFAALFLIGASGDTLSGSVKINLKLQHSDTNVDGDFVDVPKEDILIKSGGAITNPAADGIAYVIDDPAKDNLAYLAGYIGTKQYVRPVLDFVGTHNNGTFAAVAVIESDALAQPIVE